MDPRRTLRTETRDDDPTDDAALRGYLREYYGQTLEKTSDLQQSACCADTTTSLYRDIVAKIPSEVVDRNYGCGVTIPPDDLTGLRVLDLGSGTGLDAFIVSALVGPTGHVIGVDMTAEQLEIARRNAPIVARNLGYESPNIEFHEGYIETLDSIESDSVDLVISDCVINLSPRKDKVFEAMWRVLRNGGEFYVSDIIADRRVPESLQHDRQLVAECLGGALYEFDLRDILVDAGFLDPRQVTRHLVEEDVAGQPIRFWSSTFRGHKFSRPLDRRCEDYGQAATYHGNCPGLPARFSLDDHHVFEAGRPLAVCRNTARMCSETRLAKYFEVSREIRHFGIFPCGPKPASTDTEKGTVSCC